MGRFFGMGFALSWSWAVLWNAAEMKSLLIIGWT
jgi:hypothetical protein